MIDSGNILVQPTPATASAPVMESRFAGVKARLKAEYGDAAYRSWIEPVGFAAYTGGTLEISVPTRFVRDWVRTHYADRIRALWAAENGACTRVECVITGKSAAPATFDRDAAPVPVANENTQNAAQNAAADLSSPLDARFTFDTFVAGPSNALALAAAKRVAAFDAAGFNPLFFQGGVGLGKTHLMQAIAADIRAAQPEKRVVYMSAEKFMYQFVRALRARDTMAFKEAFRTIDVLMIDDIQFICGKDSTQEEFFHTFNALIDQGRQVVLSADRAPADLDGIDDRLKSRMGMGLVAAIQPATFEMRLDILRAKCAMMKRDLPEDVLVFLAEKIATNVRELEGALNRLVAHAELAGCAVTRDSAALLLQDLLRAADRRVTVEEIQQAVAAHYNIRMADMLSPRRARPVARPRQVAMYLAKALTEHSLPEIGRKFGGRDHTTIIHGIRKIEELMPADAGLAADIDALKRLVAG